MTILTPSNMRLRFDTISVNGVYDNAAAADNLGSIIEPAYLTTAQHFESSEAMRACLAGETEGWVYTRLGNPTINYLEQTLSALEGYGSPFAVSAVAVSSGMTAAFMATSPFLSAATTGRANVVVSGACYGGTFMLMTERYRRERGIEIRWVRDPMSAEQWASLVDKDTRFLYAEVPSNPTLELCDISLLSRISRQAGLPLIVDATLATPALLRPLTLGADIVVHSIGKGMGSSGMSVGGAVIARHGIASPITDPDVNRNFARYLKKGPLRDIGCVLSPFNALMALNDLRGLRSRMDAMSASALSVATFLENHTAVERVFYPGLASHRAHDLARRDMILVDSGSNGFEENRFGYLLCFRPKGGVEAAHRIFDRFSLIWRANDLGRVRSTATIPAIATHKQVADTGSDIAVIPPDMIRLSVGLENLTDIVNDLTQSLQ